MPHHGGWVVLLLRKDDPAADFPCSAASTMRKMEGEARCCGAGGAPALARRKPKGSLREEMELLSAILLTGKRAAD